MIVFRNAGILILGILFLSQCVPAVKQEQVELGLEVDYQLSDTTVMHLADWQQSGQVQSIYPFLHVVNATYRYAAALDLGSMAGQYKTDSLVPLLTDPSPVVRAQAAYSLGLSGDAAVAAPLVEAFQQYDSTGQYYLANRAILEAIGRVGDTALLEPISTVATYKPTDTLLLEGQTRAIYQYMLRGIIDPAGTATMVKYATSAMYPYSVRLLSAHYLGRANPIDLSTYSNELLEGLASEANVYLRMPLILAVGKTKSPEALTELKKSVVQEPDFRLRCNAIRALGNFPFNQAQDVIVRQLNDANESIALTAAQWISDHATEGDRTLLSNLAYGDYSDLVKAKIIGAALRHIPYPYGIARNNRASILSQMIQKENNTTIKGLMIKELAYDLKSYREILKWADDLEAPVRTAALEGITSMLKDNHYNAAFGGGESVKKELISALITAANRRDPAAIQLTAAVLVDPKTKNLWTTNEVSQMETLFASLNVDFDHDAYNGLGESLAKRQDKTYKAEPIQNYADIQWNLLSQYENAQVVVQTVRGTFTMRFFSAAAPCTVSRIIELIIQGFYDGKVFHRVVPNFVVQTGCPRGDGYGSLPITLHSELAPLQYNQEGLVGMASSGKDTESSQFFVTLSPTPHLDGKYTIFAKVISGMDVVQSIQPGDPIQKISLQ